MASMGSIWEGSTGTNGFELSYFKYFSAPFPGQSMQGADGHLDIVSHMGIHTNGAGVVISVELVGKVRGAGHVYDSWFEVRTIRLSAISSADKSQTHGHAERVFVVNVKIQEHCILTSL